VLDGNSVVVDAGPGGAPDASATDSFGAGTAPTKSFVSVDAAVVSEPTRSGAEICAACDAGPADGGGFAILGEPSVDLELDAQVANAAHWIEPPTFTANPNVWAPLVGILSMATDVPVEISATVRGGGEEWQVRPPAAARITYPIVGLKPETTYDVTVQVVNGVSPLLADAVTWTTPPLPEAFPHLDVELSLPEQMEPGMTMFAPRYVSEPNRAPVVIVDHEGEVRWFYNNPDYPVTNALSLIGDRELLFASSTCNISRLSIAGEVERTWYAAGRPGGCPAPVDAIPVPVHALHHDVVLMSNGNLLALSAEPVQVDSYPSSEDDPEAPWGPATIFAGVIVEFTEEGELVKYVRLADLLDTSRIGRDSVNVPWPTFYTTEADKDWDHVNAVVYDDASDAYYVSMRHQDALIKIDRDTETLSWILGSPANWKAPWTEKLLAPVGDLTWQFHQHSVDVTPRGIVCYDNGNYRAGAFEPFSSQRTYSRAVFFHVDEETMTVSQTWQYGPAEGDESVFGEAMGDADYQRVTGNVLITHPSGVRSDDANAAQLVEVTSAGERVFVMNVRGPTIDGLALGAALYRAERIPDLRY
jgi:arylsulfate sulfotransferase